jgi:hypothetical protein
MTEGLALGQVVVPDADTQTYQHAGLEIRRTHKAAGV